MLKLTFEMSTVYMQAIVFIFDSRTDDLVKMSCKFLRQKKAREGLKPHPSDS